MSVNTKEIFDYTKSPKEDYYGLLGCDPNASVEQICAEYKARALLFHPDKNPGDTEAEEKFQLLNEAKEVLCDPEKRLKYDKWRMSGIAISYKQWLGMKEHVEQSMHWSVPKTKDRMLGTSDTLGPSGPSSMSAAHRRASEGGAALHWGGRSGSKALDPNKEATNEVVNKFRNYEI